jgi:hypothetical protein
MEPLGGMMCPVPEDVTYASYRAVEGVVTPNGALHGTILEYNCNIGYRSEWLLRKSNISVQFRQSIPSLSNDQC